MSKEGIVRLGVTSVHRFLLLLQHDCRESMACRCGMEEMDLTKGAKRMMQGSGTLQWEDGASGVARRRPRLLAMWLDLEREPRTAAAVEGKVQPEPVLGRCWSLEVMAGRGAWDPRPADHSSPVKRL